jgi:riboflavin kinase/FMN adenylyltransferase
MTVLKKVDELARVPGPVALAIGVFDGLHLGHQEVIRAAQQHAAQHQGTAVVMTFEPHPLRVLRPEAAPRQLVGPGHETRLLAAMGIQWSLLYPFTGETAVMSAAEFVQSLVRTCRPLGCISVGYTWVFGRQREGDIHLLMDLGQQNDFAVYGVPPIKVDGEVVSSTQIRDAVSSADLQKAARLLGRPYSLYGHVTKGRQLARQWQFPTANVVPEAELLPPWGVYAVIVNVKGVWWPGVANLGVRPTVDSPSSSHPLLEVHLLDWSGDLYGKTLEVRLESYLRPERKFADVGLLQAQIKADAAQARQLFGL